MATANMSDEHKPVGTTSASQSVHLDAAVFGASVQLPTFDKVEAETWFADADDNFALRKVTDSTTKYYYVLSKLDASTLRKLLTFIKRRRGDDPYGEIKNVLCEVYEPPLEQKLDALLALTDMGDKRPKEFRMELVRLASDASLDDVLKRIFVRCLPDRVLTAITSSLGGKLAAVINAADKAWTAAAKATSTTNAVAVSTTSGPGSSRGGKQRGLKASGQLTKVF